MTILVSEAVVGDWEGQEEEVAEKLMSYITPFIRLSRRRYCT